ncbi:MAG: hypothetical protein JHC87_06415 [Thermoleophilaceae bacterium]|nr:hypothetical protein [Thermoleophilaceae bacterium]
MQKRHATIALSGAAAVLGLVSIFVTLANGGGPFARGVALGITLFAIGALRVFLTIKGRPQ